MSEKKGFFGGLFGGKKKSGCCDMEIVEVTEGGCESTGEEGSCCCSDCVCPPDGEGAGAPPTGDRSLLRVLGTGCAKCNLLEENVKAAIADMDGNYTIGKVTSITEIAALGALVTPALMVGDKLVASGKVLSPDEIKNILKSEG